MLTEHSLACNTHQLAISRWLRVELKLGADAPVYFDDADLVYIDETVVAGALVSRVKLLTLRRALAAHIAAV